LGLANLRARLQQLYSGSAELSVDIEKGGATVIVILPYCSDEAALERPLPVGDLIDEPAG
jgi:hypothetical protein